MGVWGRQGGDVAPRGWGLQAGAAGCSCTHGQGTHASQGRDTHLGLHLNALHQHTVSQGHKLAKGRLARGENKRGALTGGRVSWGERQGSFWRESWKGGPFLARGNN